MNATDLASRIRQCLPADGVREQKMFGGLCFMLRGNMVAGTMKQGELLVRVGSEAHEAAVTRPGARPMIQGGRTSRGVVIVAPDAIATAAALKSWIDPAVAFAATLPAK